MSRLQGMDLIRDIDACTLNPGQCAFWWLGQHSFVLKMGQTILYLDPFLADLPGRKVRPLLKPQEITNADLILGSHDHTDHIDRTIWPALAAASPRATFVVPSLQRNRLAGEIAMPSERLMGLDDAQSFSCKETEVIALPAAHELLDRDPRTGQHPYLGFVIKGNGCTVYHSGDTCIYPGLYDRLLKYRPDVMFLPINGRDAERLARGCIGNMTYQEAADLAGLIQPQLTVPAHFDMFQGNTEDPQLFVDYMNIKYPNLSTCIPQYGTPTMVSGKGLTTNEHE